MVIYHNTQTAQNHSTAAKWEQDSFQGCNWIVQMLFEGYVKA